ncbi:hypothetical protein MTO96_022927 [Rhipicephalus appendiculatus]
MRSASLSPRGLRCQRVLLRRPDTGSSSSLGRCDVAPAGGLGPRCAPRTPAGRSPSVSSVCIQLYRIGTAGLTPSKTARATVAPTSVAPAFGGGAGIGEALGASPSFMIAIALRVAMTPFF